MDGSNLALETRFGEPHQMAELARELVRTKPDVVVAVPNPDYQAVASASSEIPIVAASWERSGRRGDGREVGEARRTHHRRRHVV